MVQPAPQTPPVMVVPATPPGTGGAAEGGGGVHTPPVQPELTTPPDTGGAGGLPIFRRRWRHIPWIQKSARDEVMIRTLERDIFNGVARLRRNIIEEFQAYTFWSVQLDHKGTTVREQAINYATNLAPRRIVDIYENVMGVNFIPSRYGRGTLTPFSMNALTDPIGQNDRENYEQSLRIMIDSWGMKRVQLLFARRNEDDYNIRDCIHDRIVRGSGDILDRICDRTLNNALTRDQVTQMYIDARDSCRASREAEDL